jgi:predicted PurR-regulated permease PerM
MSGVRQAAVWSIVAGVFNSIPYFGPVIVSGGLSRSRSSSSASQ